ncbi:hypothetical protein MPTK1_4g07600 [Marchantia polymorpha subsp. ruderalis]|uniref:Uncharacterized protein n=2 Tax=Marchantia polymorpha TaxID=3197 RepID=A0AAF6B7H2_MARPO|nr:hypothetical protein MARPO_0115s0021 [Marchantia polymorpha]BBN07956.1 hypothetical protein Mp_4g07600 [Marchantia polymorpha subsp. ruderalis]|eukprot:PTQ31098.1 hypothetical protein MARPO_0115s0021 [Marchantia polymorpha]
MPDREANGSGQMVELVSVLFLTGTRHASGPAATKHKVGNNPDKDHPIQDKVKGSTYGVLAGFYFIRKANRERKFLSPWALEGRRRAGEAKQVLWLGCWRGGGGGGGQEDGQAVKEWAGQGREWKGRSGGGAGSASQSSGGGGGQ